MKALKLAATLLSTLVLTAIGATSAQASTHLSGVSGFEFSATSTEGRFAGTAAGDLSGAWDIWVKHTDLGFCFNHPSDPCTINDGTFRLVVTSPAQVVTGRFDNFAEASNAVPAASNQIKRLPPSSGNRCQDEVFFITDGLKGVGAIGSQYTGTGTFTAWLTHHWKEDPFFHRCFIVGATVQGSVKLIF